MNSTKAKRYHLRRLEELGCDVSKIAAALSCCEVTF
jgi:hypothetical protein